MPCVVTEAEVKDYSTIRSYLAVHMFFQFFLQAGNFLQAELINIIGADSTVS